MKKDFWKKALMVLIGVFCAISIGTSVSGWVNDAKDKNTDNENADTQACIECVVDA